MIIRFQLSGSFRIFFPGSLKTDIAQNGWFIMENLIKIDDLGVPLFLETPIFIKHQVFEQHGHHSRVTPPFFFSF